MKQSETEINQNLEQIPTASTKIVDPLRSDLKGARLAPSFLDHITVTAYSLEAGVDFVTETLGVTPQAGGAHPRMATHNRLLRLGEAMFLEVIAPNWTAQAPTRPRWFDLDSLKPKSQPLLSTWVVRTPNIQATMKAASEALGDIELMSRGALNWFITIPADGSVPLNGIAPALIEWPTGVHPATSLEDKGLSLVKLEIFHPMPERVARLLASVQLNAPIVVLPTQPGMSAQLLAHINTPLGLRILSAPSYGTTEAQI